MTRGPDGLIDVKHPGPRPKLNAEQHAALGRLVEDAPQPAIDCVVRWRLKDLVAWIQEAFAICMDETTLGRMLRAMGYRKLSARLLRPSKRVLSFAIDIHPLGLERAKYTHDKSKLEKLITRKAKPKQKMKAPRKAAAAFNEAATW